MTFEAYNAFRSRSAPGLNGWHGLHHRVHLAGVYLNLRGVEPGVSRASVARTFEKLVGLGLREPPLDVPGLALSQIGHERQAHDPALRWLRTNVGAIARSLGPPRDRVAAESRRQTTK